MKIVHDNKRILFHDLSDIVVGMSKRGGSSANQGLWQSKILPLVDGGQRSLPLEIIQYGTFVLMT